MHHVLQPLELHECLEFRDESLSYTGIGQGSVESDTRAKIPIAIQGMTAQFSTTVFEQGDSRFVPALLGLTSLLEHRAVIDLSSKDKPFMLYDTALGRQKLNLAIAGGHIVLPFDEFEPSAPGAALPTKLDFCNNKLGSRTVFMNQGTCDNSTQTEAEASCFPVLPDATVSKNTMLALRPRTSEKGTSARPSPKLTEKVATGELTRILRAIRAEYKGTDAMTRAQKRYSGLPADTPPPDIDIWLNESGEWDFWEWWAGEAVVTKEALKAGLRCGPPITYSTGWDINLPSHQAALWRLTKAKKPKIIMGEPDCGIWSQSNTTTPPDVKNAIRLKQLVGLKFYRDVCKNQSALHYAFLTEQPKSSELLRHPVQLEVCDLPNVKDSDLCMCRYKLRDPFSKRPYKKPTTLRGTVKCHHSGNWCTGDHDHQMLQGKLPTGQSRTSYAATYTRTFARALIKDFKMWLHEHGFLKTAFPTKEAEKDFDSDDLEQMLRDLEETEAEATPAPVTPRVQASREWLEPRSKAQSKPPTRPKGQQLDPVEPKPPKSTPSSSSKDLPKEKPWELSLIHI